MTTPFVVKHASEIIVMELALVVCSSGATDENVPAKYLRFGPIFNGPTLGFHCVATSNIISC